MEKCSWRGIESPAGEKWKNQSMRGGNRNPGGLLRMQKYKLLDTDKSIFNTGMFFLIILGQLRIFS